MKCRIYKISLYLLLATCYMYSSCQKDINVKLPAATQKICVDGRIEPGMPPYVILTHSMPYFGPTDPNSLQNMFVHDAVITVSNGATTVTLTEYCSKSLPDSLLPIVASFTGVDTASLKLFDYCIYTTLNTSIFGAVGKTYNLTINSDGKTYTSTTSILTPILLDKTWYQYLKTDSKGDSLGYVYAHLTDPPPIGNCYRWLAMRKGKDQSFLAPSGSAFDDKFFNEQSFDFAYNRGMVPNSTATDDNNDEAGYFIKGDTVIVKFCTIDIPSYNFFFEEDVAMYSQGNPFASPSSVPSNVYPQSDALGIWCGYGVSKDTVIFK